LYKNEKYGGFKMEFINNGYKVVCSYDLGVDIQNENGVINWFNFKQGDKFLIATVMKIIFKKFTTIQNM
jgi:hypothetical protein